MPKDKLVLEIKSDGTFRGVRERGMSSFQIRYTNADGVRQEETVEAETAEQAATIRAQRLIDVRKGRIITSKPQTVTFRELAKDVVQHYIVNELDSMADIEGRFRLHLLPVFGHRKAVSIGDPDIRDYKIRRREEGAANNTIDRELEAMKRAYRLGMTSTPAKIHTCPNITLIKDKKSIRKGFYEREQLEAICRHLPTYLAPVARFGYITGWRHQEVLTLEWRHVDFDNGVVRLFPGETKNDEGRAFPMVAELRKLLESIQPEHVFPAMRVFLRNGEPIRGFYKAWSTACRKAGMPVRWVPILRRTVPGDIHSPKVAVLYQRGKKKGQPILQCRAAAYFHDFRRTAYRNLVWAGVPEKQARLAVGWLDADTADRYNVPSPSDVDVIRERYEARYGFGTTRGTTAPKTSIKRN